MTLDGFVAGLLVALPFALRGSGEPTVTMQMRAYVIWFLVVGMMGVLNAITLYVLATVLARRTKPGDSAPSNENGR